MLNWSQCRLTFLGRRSAAMLVGGLIVLAVGCWLSGTGRHAQATSSAAAKTTLTHAERVVLTAERMHKTNVRAHADDTLEDQLRNVALGDVGLQAGRGAARAEWRLRAFGDGRCCLQVEAGGDWSPKAARVALAEFTRFSSVLCPDADRKTKSLVHYVGHGRPEQATAGGYDIRVTLFEEDRDTDHSWWQLLIELWPVAG
jgi:hypothetical protein